MHQDVKIYKIPYNSCLIHYVWIFKKNDVFYTRAKIVSINNKAFESIRSVQMSRTSGLHYGTADFFPGLGDSR